MISKLKIKGGITMPFQDKEHGFQYPSDIDIEFTKGLNVIVGPNGSGKSTILRILESFMMISDPYIIETNGGSIIRDFFKEERWGHYSDTSAFDVYADYANKAFRMPKMSDIDRYFVGGGTMYDFALAKAYCSKGESAEIVLSKTISLAQLRKSKFDFQKAFGECLSRYGDHPYICKHRIPDEGITTILVDEPDAHLDVFKIETLADVLARDRSDIQLIAAIHNPLLIYRLSQKNEVHFIEMEKGYVGRISDAIKRMTK